MAGRKYRVLYGTRGLCFTIDNSSNAMIDYYEIKSQPITRVMELFSYWKLVHP
ncbi:MAG: hypothetical protein H0V01_02040 [Bacteroidetes bacterium]|nr:hypothetical protein [Bacteroidota bacterium]HET6245275.1 hypothetical protein [Bacteroidia bacterium]